MVGGSTGAETGTAADTAVPEMEEGDFVDSKRGMYG